MTPTDPLAQASQFFDRYSKLFDQGHWSEFADLFHVPAMTVLGDGSVRMLASRDEAERFFQGVSEQWKSLGYHHFTIAEMVVLCLGSRSRLVTFRWRMHSSAGDVIRTWLQSYQLLNVQTDWRVLASTFHSAEGASG